MCSASRIVSSRKILALSLGWDAIFTPVTGQAQDKQEKGCQRDTQAGRTTAKPYEINASQAFSLHNGLAQAQPHAQNVQCCSKYKHRRIRAFRDGQKLCLINAVVISILWAMLVKEDAVLGDTQDTVDKNMCGEKRRGRRNGSKVKLSTFEYGA